MEAQHVARKNSDFEFVKMFLLDRIWFADLQQS